MKKSPGNKRKIVWIFGAGASRGAGAYTAVQRGGKIPIPMQSDFWDTTLRFATAADEKLIEAFLFKYFMGYKKTPPKIRPAERRKYFAEVSVEEVFTFLSERISTPTISSQLKSYYKDQIWDALIRSISITFKRFSANSSTKSVYKDFYKNHLRSRDAIISFNYDTVLEESLKNKNLYHYGFTKKDKKIPIFKPHGSINWGVSQTQQLKLDPNTKTPLIVAPTHLKLIGLSGIDGTQTNGFLNSNSAITDIWTAMEKQMDQAKSIVFIGYSFPEADLYFSSVLRTVLSKSKIKIKVILVNPDSLRIAEKIRNRFAIQPENIEKHFDIKSFCKLSRNDIMQ